MSLTVSISTTSSIPSPRWPSRSPDENSSVGTMRAVAYIRVSDLSQVEGHSLDAQERLFRELCRNREWEPVGIYREEGKSAHTDSIRKRPAFRQLLDDAGKGQFDVVVVHTLDRWSRNLRVMLESMGTLGKHGVGLVSITENIDYSTPHGKMATQMLGSVAEFFSEALSTHVKKGIDERARQGFHLGSIPFGYQSCRHESNGERKLVCKPEHSGGVHVHPEEGRAVREIFTRYASGTITMATLASWLNDEGFRTRNTKKLPDGNGGYSTGPRLFTNASVRHILHNLFYTGQVRHKDQLLPGLHESLVVQGIFQTVQDAMRRNSGRSRTLHTSPEREYLLKGLIHCVHCRMPMWAQTFVNGRRYYREQRGSRGAGYCVGRSGSMFCEVPDEQMGNIISAIVLPDAWVDRVLAQVHLADEVERVGRERKKAEQRLRRLAQVYVDGHVPEEEYRRKKNIQEEKLRSLVVPDADAAVTAGKLLEDLPALWEKADLGERRRILLTMLDAVYVDTVEERSIVAIRPRPAFRPLFEIATTREGSGIVLVNERDLKKANQPPPHGHEADANSCSWWRRGRVELHRELGMMVLLAA